MSAGKYFYECSEHADRELLSVNDFVSSSPAVQTIEEDEHVQPFANADGHCWLDIERDGEVDSLSFGREGFAKLGRALLALSKVYVERVSR